MILQFYMPLWGHEDEPFQAFARRVKKTGFDGIEMNLPTGEFDYRTRSEYVKIARDEGLLVALQHVQSNESDPKLLLSRLEARIEAYAQVKPEFINSHSGRDFFNTDDNLAIIDELERLSEQFNVPIYHETHRSRFNFAAHVCADFVKRRPAIKQTADYSHFCCVAETLLEDQSHNLALILPSIHHIHARVGQPQAPQVNDPSAPEHKSAFDAHITWWKAIIKMAKARGDRSFSITPEFGPMPYMPSTPFKKEPLASQWDINANMREQLLIELS